MQLQAIPQGVDQGLGIFASKERAPVTDEEIIDLRNKLNYLRHPRLEDIKRNLKDLSTGDKDMVPDWIKRKVYSFKDKDGKDISISGLVRDILEVAKNLAAERSITCSDGREGIAQMTDTTFIPSLKTAIYNVLNPNNSPILNFRNLMNSPFYTKRIESVDILQTAINNIVARVDKYLQENKCPAGMNPVKVKSNKYVGTNSNRVIDNGVQLRKTVDMGKPSATGPELFNWREIQKIGVEGRRIINNAAKKPSATGPELFNGREIHKIGVEGRRIINNAAKKPSATGPQYLTNTEAATISKSLADQATSATGATMGGYRRKSRKSRKSKSRKSKSKSKSRKH